MDRNVQIYLEIPAKVKRIADQVNKLLGIKNLNIRIVPYVFNSPTIYAMGYSSAPIKGVLPDEYCKGSFIEGENTIYLARCAPIDEVHCIIFDDTDIIESMLHEIRHVWQKNYHKDIYYAEENAISNDEHMEDISEIDADAFAISYAICKLGFKNEDISLDMGYKCTIDGGKRLQRVLEIVKEYGLAEE